MTRNRKANLKEYYFIAIPLILTLVIYLPSLFFGFRNFDENIVIKDFYTHKTFIEYIEKYLLVGAGGLTEAGGYSFSGIRNVHLTILVIPVFYLISFLFQAKPFLFHSWSLLLHCIALYFFIQLCFQLTLNKHIALVSGLVWTLHPANVESIIWATNWPQPLALVLYLFTLNKIASLINKGLINQISVSFIMFMTAIQIFFNEHTITIPLAIFLTLFYLTKQFKMAFKVSLPSFFVFFIYVMLRILSTCKYMGSESLSSHSNLFERLLFFSPQIFVHQLKLIFFPKTLSIDQLDLLRLDHTFLGSFNLFCLAIFVLYLLCILLSRSKAPYLSYGLLMNLITLSVFLQIIPFYSLVAERYNYFGSAFLIFGIVATLINFRADTQVCHNKAAIVIIIVICILLGCRSSLRISDWKDNSTLFQSTINTSRSFLKKGIWTYDLAISEENESKKKELLELSNNLLKLFIKNLKEGTEPHVLQNYELDSKSLLSKAAFRIATNCEILNQRKFQLEYLLKALDFSRQGTQIQAQIYKNLGTFYFQDNNINKAMGCYKKSYAISPNPSINYAIAVCYLKLNDYVNYENYLQKAVSVISPYNMSPFKTYGQFLELSKNDYDSAIKYYKIATLLENKPEPYILLSTLYIKLKQVDNALKYIKRGLHSFPNNPTLIYYKECFKIK